MPLVPRFNPAYVVVTAEMIDLNVAGGAGADSGVGVVIAPMNCTVAWIGYAGAVITDTGTTTITLVHTSENGHLSRATPTVLNIPAASAANVAVTAEVSAGVQNNQWQAGEPIIVTSGGQTAAVDVCDFTLVLVPL